MQTSLYKFTIFFKTDTSIRCVNEVSLTRYKYTASVQNYSKDIMETYYSGKAYYELADHPAARIIWYQEGWELLQNPPASQPKNPSVRIQHICPYADSIKDEDELMQKFTQLSRIIE